jgi:ATP-binding cassette subfamily B protein
VHAREWWQGATLLCVTHDIGETQSFDRVVVIDSGRVIADGSPVALARDPDSPYARMLAQERELHARAWSDPAWRRLRLRQGRLEP